MTQLELGKKNIRLIILKGKRKRTDAPFLPVRRPSTVLGRYA